ncbi:MAG: spore germination protein [Syntrophomonadaceae bacterium]|jgi:spore germination protein KA
MFGKLIRKVNYLKLKTKTQPGANSSRQDSPVVPIPRSIAVVKTKLQEMMAESSDLVIREITMGNEAHTKIIVAFIDGLIDIGMVNTSILRPIMLESRLMPADRSIKRQAVSTILKEYLLPTADLKVVTDFKQTIQNILSGHAAIYINGEPVALTADLKGWQSRAVEDPETESVVRGPREGFTETLRTNTALLRRKIINPNLKFENITIGERTNTAVCIAYIKGLTDERIIETVRRRIKEIKIDAILESEYIEEFIEDAPFSIFSTIGNSEKPDIVAAKMLEGRVAIFCDGTPFVLTVPYLFIEGFQASEDYYSPAPLSSVTRFMRLVAYMITTTLPAVYLAFAVFTPGVIPFELLLTILASRVGIPYSIFTEALLMLLSFEILREAGVRIPKPVGPAVSIVGALVIGQSAVEAGLASTPMVIITALTAITSFITPPLTGTMLFLRVAFLIGANVIGFLGILFVFITLIIHLSTIRSFGVPYLSPLTPITLSDLKDTYIRVPWWAMLTRPRVLTWDDDPERKYRMR